MENKNQKNENIKFHLPADRVFYFYKDGKVELIIANKDFTKFRTIDQLIEMKGDVTNEIVPIHVGEISDKIDKINSYYDSLCKEKMLDSYRYFIGSSKRKTKKWQEYRELEQKRIEEINSVIAEPNKFLKKFGYEIDISGCLSYNRVQLNDVVSVADEIEYSGDGDAIEYFLRSGEMLHDYIEANYFGEDLEDEEVCFESINELKTFKRHLQEKYNEVLRNPKEEREVKENNEKYLEF